MKELLCLNENAERSFIFVVGHEWRLWPSSDSNGIFPTVFYQREREHQRAKWDAAGARGCFTTCLSLGVNSQKYWWYCRSMSPRRAGLLAGIAAVDRTCNNLPVSVIHARVASFHYKM